MKAGKYYILIGLSIIAFSYTIEAEWPRWIKKLTKLIDKPSDQDVCPPAIKGAITDNITAQLKQRLGQANKNTVDDASCLNKTNVFAIVQPTKKGQIKEVVTFARAHNMHVSIAAGRFSMGGQTFYPNCIILDMTKYNKMLYLDHVKKTVHVQSGITWETIQDHVDDYSLSIRAMQSSNIFSVGGSMSVNAHGMDHKAGSVAQTIQSFRLMMVDGSIKKVTQVNNPELFELVLGGYGLFGIILDVEIDLTDNVAYMPDIKLMKTTKLAQDLHSIISNPHIGIFYAHLSTSPHSMLNDAMLYQYERQTFTSKVPRLSEAKNTRFKRLILNLAKKR
ncbi:MAG TPA: FAD-binding oxidoreductase [Candidatus Babeliales bacterium]|nr:FAD-binding oxidoreductase [Candidatus Babeliales bacterium]